MLIYDLEYKDGLGDIMKANASIAGLCPLLSACVVVPESTASSISQSFATIGEYTSEDLHKLYSILVSVGWNLNDDVFTKAEIWKSRNTPINKPFNIEHKPRQIIGHITKSCLVNEKYELIDDNLAFDKVPDKFHILTSAVIYKHLKSFDKDLTKETEELIASIANGDWYVSMECLFTDFDYAITKADGSHNIVPRNEETCFLSKHLKVYKGSGSYQDAKIGRCLKNILFSGKGLVKVPGNPESYIFSDTSSFTGIASSLKEVFANRRIIPMADTTTDVVSKSEYAIAQKEIADLRTRLESLQEASVKKQIEDAQATASAKEEEVKTVKVELDNVKASKKELETTIATLTEKVKEVTDKLEAANTVIAKANAEKITLNRVSTLTEKGVEKSEAEKIVASSASASDEIFALIVDAHSKLATATVKPTETQKAKEDEVKLEEVKTPEATKANLTPETNTDETNETLVALASLLESYATKNGGK